MTRAHPVVGITCGTSSSARQTPRFGLNQVYINSVAAAGGIALLIPPMKYSALAGLLERVDGLVIPGGADLNPSLYGEAPGPHLEYVDHDRDATELAALRVAARRGTPVFGICRGLQMINVAHGGTLYQDIRSQLRTRLRHKTPRTWGRDFLVHDVEIESGSWFGDTVRARGLRVNSLHHQAVKEPGRGLRVTAISEDGVVEGLESVDRRVVAVQCHPEELPGQRWAGDLFRGFVARLKD